MNKKIWFSLAWIVNVLLLFILIIVPKTNMMYQIFYILTMIMIFVIPLFLTFFQTFMQIKTKEKERDIYIINANVGCSLIILLTFVNFMGSIDKIAIPQMLTILFLFVLIELLLGYIKYMYINMSIKQTVWINVATYVSLVIFFVCAMIISVDYGII